MAAPTLKILEGWCQAVYQFDIGLAIDLERCAREVAGKPTLIRRDRPAPPYFQFRPPPLCLAQEAEPIAVGEFATTGTVTSVLYDFGAVSVSYLIPVDGGLAEMARLSDALSREDLLASHSAQHVRALMASIRQSVTRPGLAEPVEDYFIFQIARYESGCALAELTERYAAPLAQILRGEPLPLSAQEIGEALACQVSYGADDLALIDWQAAILFDRAAEDVRAVLEFVNVQLLELRWLDSQLDDQLDVAYEALGSRGRRLAAPTSELFRIARMEVEGAILFEKVGNALKLIGDQYLARLYRLAASRFRLAEWNVSIQRKLQTIESIYQKLQDRASARRLEALEWIIIVLIAVSILLPFLPGLAGK